MSVTTPPTKRDGCAETRSIKTSTVRGELDIATAPALRYRLDAAAKAGTHRLVMDLSAVSFLDSVALATIPHAKQREFARIVR